MGKSLIIILFISFTGLTSYGGDSTVVDTSKTYEHFPKRAALLSLIPATGQMYNEFGYRKFGKKNRAWWKVPLIYGGLGATGYFWWKNYHTTLLLKKEILYRQEFGEDTYFHESLQQYSSVDSLINGYADFVQITDSTVQRVDYLGFDDRARRRDLLMFATVGIYALQMLEAYVDGHFVSFDVSDDLSMSWYPKMVAPKTPGIGITLSFK